MYKSNAPEWWAPTYKMPGGGMFSVSGCRSNECPVSAITPESRELIDIYNRAKLLNKEVGLRQEQLSLKIADAFVIISQEQTSFENALNDTIAMERRGTA